MSKIEILFSGYSVKKCDYFGFGRAGRRAAKKKPEYAKDQSYDQWPAPFNRSEVKASADQKFHIWDETYISKLDRR